jgi:hypothetical protein
MPLRRVMPTDNVCARLSAVMSVYYTWGFALFICWNETCTQRPVGNLDGREHSLDIGLTFDANTVRYYRWLRHYARNRKVASWKPDEVTKRSSIHVIFPAVLSPEVDSASNRYEYRSMFLGRRAQPVRKADNLAAICEPIVWTTLDYATPHNRIDLYVQLYFTIRGNIKYLWKEHVLRYILYSFGSGRKYNNFEYSNDCSGSLKVMDFWTN